MPNPISGFNLSGSAVFHDTFQILLNGTDVTQLFPLVKYCKCGPELTYFMFFRCALITCTLYKCALKI